MATEPSNKHFHWAHRAVLGILEAERPAAQAMVQKSAAFKRDAVRASDLLRRIIEPLLDFHFDRRQPPDPVAIAGGWSDRNDGPARVVELPSLRRRQDVEDALTELGGLLGEGLGGLFVTAGPGYGNYTLVWCNDDNQPHDIADEKSLLDLLLHLRTERSTDQRYRDVYKALNEGRAPSPPPYMK